MFLLISCKQVDSKSSPDYAAFLTVLEKNGFQYTKGDTDAESFLSVERRPVWIGDEIISIYEYATNNEMEVDAAYIDRGGCSISVPGKMVKISWVSYPYFFKDGRIIINYVGENEEILEFLYSNYGKPFAGYDINEMALEELREADASHDLLAEPDQLDDNTNGNHVPFVENEYLSSSILDKIYLGMTNEEVHELFGDPDYMASGLMWYGYKDIGTFDPSFGFNGLIERITLVNGWSWSINDLINTAVKQQSSGQYYTPDGAYPTQSHTILSLDANKDGFTVYIMSLWMTFLPDGEYNVRDVSGTHSPLALTFAKNRNGDYELMEYWQPNDGTNYMPSIRSKFPQSIWDKVDTQLYIDAHNKNCYDQAMYFFVGALPNYARFGFHKGGTAAITNYAESSTVNDDMFLINIDFHAE